MLQTYKIQTCQIFGSADSPRVMGGQSAVHENCLPETAEKLSTAEIHCGQSAYAGQILPEAVSVSWQCKKFKGGRSARLSRTVREWTEGGVGQT